MFGYAAGFNGIGGAQLGEDILSVSVYRVDTDKERLRYLFAQLAFVDELQHFFFPFRDKVTEVLPVQKEDPAVGSLPAKFCSRNLLFSSPFTFICPILNG